MTADELAAVSTIRVRLERLGEKLSLQRLPVELMHELAGIVFAIRALEGDAGKGDGGS